jgi:transposase
MRRTAAVNQIRGLLLERGLPIPKGRSHVNEALFEIQRDASVKLSDAFLILLGQLKVELDQLTARIEQMDEVLWQTWDRSRLANDSLPFPGLVR